MKSEATSRLFGQCSHSSVLVPGESGLLCLSRQHWNPASAVTVQGQALEVPPGAIFKAAHTKKKCAVGALTVPPIIL
eukprot:3499576-Amphidinium_carterae.1